MDLLDKLLSNKIVNTNGYTRSDTGTKVHSYLRTHPKNQGLTKSATRSIINALKKKQQLYENRFSSVLFNLISRAFYY